MPTARKVTLRIGGSLGCAGSAAPSRSAILRLAQDDERLLESREIDRWFCLHFLIDTEIALRHLRHSGHRYAAGKPTTHAARNEEIAHVDLVRSLNVLDANSVSALIADATNEPSSLG